MKLKNKFIRKRRASHDKFWDSPITRTAIAIIVIGLMVSVAIFLRWLELGLNIKFIEWWLRY